MGFLGTLGKIAGAVAPFAAMAIPGVGPALGGVLGGITRGASVAAPILGALGSTASGAAQGAAQGRRDDAYAGVATQNSNLTGARDAFTAGLQGQQFNASEQDRALRRQMLASLLGGVGDVSIGRPAGSTIPTFNISGGLRPSALGNKDSLIASMNQPTMTAPTYQGPKPLDLPKPGLGEKILGGVGLGGSLLGALGRIGQRPGQYPYQTPPFVPGGQTMPMPLPPGARF